jgi:hypothetical protein
MSSTSKAALSAIRLAPQLGQKPLRSPKAPTVGAAKGEQTILVARGTLHPDETVLQSTTLTQINKRRA